MAFNRTAWIEKNKERLREYRRKYWNEHREHQLDIMRRRSRNLRQEVIDAYGGRCACCGTMEYEFLCLDHINGGGRKHRLETKSSRTTIYWQVKQDGFPKDKYRLLCWNCNAAKGIHKGCPHDRDDPGYSFMLPLDDVRIEDILLPREG